MSQFQNASHRIIFFRYFFVSYNSQQFVTDRLLWYGMHIRICETLIFFERIFNFVSMDKWLTWRYPWTRDDINVSAVLTATLLQISSRSCLSRVEAAGGFWQERFVDNVPEVFGFYQQIDEDRKYCKNQTQIQCRGLDLWQQKLRIRGGRCEGQVDEEGKKQTWQ
jgi:hypothetical protein